MYLIVFTDGNFITVSATNLMTAFANVFKTVNPDCDITVNLFTQMLDAMTVGDSVDVFNAFSIKKIAAVYSGLHAEYVSDAVNDSL